MPNFNIEKSLEKPVIGIDEVGRGPLAGPVVSCACVFFNNSIPIEELYFINDSKSEYYQTLKTQAYPVLESIIGPQFKNHPQDMVLAAELSKLMVDANKYQQIMGNQPAPRQQAAPMAGNVTPQSRPNQRQQPEFRQAANNLRGSEVSDFASMLRQRGHSWRP